MRTIHFEVWDKHPGKGRKKRIVETIDREFEEVEGVFPGAGKLYEELMIRYNGGFLRYNLGKARYDIRYW